MLMYSYGGIRYHSGVSTDLGKSAETWRCQERPARAIVGVLPFFTRSRDEFHIELLFDLQIFKQHFRLHASDSLCMRLFLGCGADGGRHTLL